MQILGENAICRRAEGPAREYFFAAVWEDELVFVWKAKFAALDGPKRAVF